MNDTRAGYLDAQRQVDRKIGFFVHLAVYLIINSGLVLSFELPPKFSLP